MPITDLDSLTFAMHSSKGGYALLLGSGLSRSAGIMTGWEVVGDLIRRLAAARGVESPADPYEWYRAECGREASYSEVLAALALTPTDRQQLLRGYFEADESDRQQGRKLPTRAHTAIASLAARAHVRVIVTTNFDPLLESALEAAGVMPVVVSTADQIEGLPPLRDIACLVVKPHGDYRDARIKNTPEELASYDLRIAGLLQRIFEEYGLVVCGWSADWDTALRETLERSRLRSTLYWTAIADLSEAAARLVALKQGRTIAISSADEFFDSLADRLAALDDFQRPHPASLELLLAQTKLYLSEPKYRIQLADLVQSEVDSALRQLRDQGLFAADGISDDASYMARLQLMDAATERLVTMVVTLSRWGGAHEGKVLARAIARLADHPNDGGQFLALRLRFYPALRVIYGAGLGAVAADSYIPLAEITRMQAHGPKFDERGSVFDKLQPYTILNGKILQSELRVYMPVSIWFAESLRASYGRAVGSEPDVDRDLDFFECLAALLSGDAVKTDDWFFPLGRYAVGSGRRPAMAEMLRQLDTEQNAWAPLQAGLFGGNVERVRAAVLRVEEALAKMGSRYGVW